MQRLQLVRGDAGRCASECTLRCRGLGKRNDIANGRSPCQQHCQAVQPERNACRKGDTHTCNQRTRKRGGKEVGSHRGSSKSVCPARPRQEANNAQRNTRHVGTGSGRHR